MQIRGWGSAAVVAVALLLGGCTPERPATETPTTSSAGATNTAGPQALPPCASVSISFEPALDHQNIRCTLTLDGDSSITVSSDPAWSFSVRRGDTTVQEFREPTDKIGQTGVAAVLQDIDQSGTPVLLVVTGRGGTGGEPMAVWRPTGQPTHFVRAGDLFGFRQFYRTPEGFFGNYAPARPREPSPSTGGTPTSWLKPSHSTSRSRTGRRARATPVSGSATATPIAPSPTTTIHRAHWPRGPRR